MKCDHDLAEMGTTCADGYCPICLAKRVTEMEDAWFRDEQIQKDGSLRPSVYDTVRRAKKAEADLAKLREVVVLAVESQGWDGNDPNENRWKEFYSKARKSLEVLSR